jgi:Tol biopolymer transport system component
VSAAVILARGVIYAMVVSVLKVPGAAVIACVLTFGGLHGLAPEWCGAGIETEDEPKAERPATQGAAINRAQATSAKAALAAGRLADALKRHPAQLSVHTGNGNQVYMLDLIEGGTTLIADEALPNHFFSNAPEWSHDGSRILFDSSGPDYPRGRVMTIVVRDGRPEYTDLGAGSRPTFSPDDQRIAFALRPGADPESMEGGVWIMKADGSDRRRVGEFGAPSWSPDGREILTNRFAPPAVSTVINLETNDRVDVKLRGHELLSWPSWAGPGMLVSSLTTDGEPDSIALLDVRNPADAKVIDVLWKRGEDLDVEPRWPIYRPDTRRCYFGGQGDMKRSIYVVERGKPFKARRLEAVEHQRPGENTRLGGLSLSPDGRYLVFQANRLVGE